MIKIDITHPSLFEPGKEVTREEYFHLFKKDLLELDQEFQKTSDSGMGLGEHLELIGKALNGLAIIQTFQMLIEASHGVRSGDDFEHDPVASTKFMGGPGYDRLLTMLLTDPDLAAKFANGIMPVDLDDLTATLVAKDVTDVALPDYSDKPTEEELRLSGLDHPLDENGGLLPWWNREPTTEEQQAMSKAQFMDVFKRKNSTWTPRGF